MDREKLAMIVAENIRSAMGRAGINPAELARAAGLNTTGVYDIMSGRSRSPRIDTIAKLADALQVPVAELLEGHDDYELRQEIIAAVEKLPVEERRRILLTAKAWSGAQ